MLAAAEAELPSLRARFAADQARWEGPSDQVKPAALAAAKAEQGAAHARAVSAVANAELQLQQAPLDQQKKAKQTLDASQASVAEAEAALSRVDENYTPLTGALKAFESSLETDEERRRPFPTTSSGRRTALARAITDRTNPLVARVAVNHIWLRHLGKPLVPTVFDFGRNAPSPTHPGTT